MRNLPKILHARFYKSTGGGEPVKIWLLALDKSDRRTIGEDIFTLEHSWPIGKPKCSAMKGYRGLYEVRSNISNGRITRILFTIVASEMILLHGFIKKTQKTPQRDLDLAAQRLNEVKI